MVTTAQYGYVAQGITTAGYPIVAQGDIIVSFGHKTSRRKKP